MATTYGYYGWQNSPLTNEDKLRNRQPYSQPNQQALTAAQSLDRMPKGGDGPGWSAPAGVTTLEQLQKDPNAYNSWVNALSNTRSLTNEQQNAAGRAGGVAGTTPGVSPWSIQPKAFQDARAWGVQNGILPKSDSWGWQDFAPLLSFLGPAYLAASGAAAVGGAAGAGAGASPGAGTTFGAAPASGGTASVSGSLNPAAAAAGYSQPWQATPMQQALGIGAPAQMSTLPSGLSASAGAAGAGAGVLGGGLEMGIGANPGTGALQDFGGGYLAGDIPQYSAAQNAAGAAQGGNAALTGGTASSQGLLGNLGNTLSNMNMKDWAGVLKDTGSVVFAGMEYANAKDAAEAYRQQLERNIAASDPFGPERAQYQKQLSELMSNPESFLNSPQVKFASDAAARKMASMGYNMSPTQSQAIADASMGEYWKQAEMLAGLSGSKITPNMGALNQATDSWAKANYNKDAALANAFRTAGETFFGTGGNTGGESKGQTIGERSFGLLDMLT